MEERIKLEIGKTYKSPEGDFYKPISIVDINCLKKNPMKMVLVRKNMKNLGTLPLVADYSSWEEIK